jgi:hypothetical protein
MFGIPSYAVTLRHAPTPCPDLDKLDKPAPRPTPAPCQPKHFAHVETWVFDLDNTLYPPETALFPADQRPMTDYVMRVTGATGPRPTACATLLEGSMARRWPG